MNKDVWKEFVWISLASLVVGGVCDGVFTYGFGINRESPWGTHIEIVAAVALAVFVALLVMVVVLRLMRGGMK